MITHNPKRMDIYLAELPAIIGSVQHGKRPVVIIQNNVGNDNSPTVVVVPMTSKYKPKMPTHVGIGRATGINRESTILCEQIMTLDKAQLIKKIGQITCAQTIESLERAIAVSIDLSMI